MKTIVVRVVGDRWIDIDLFQQTLYAVPVHENIALDFQAEGPSIQALGIKDVLDKCCLDTGRSPSTIFLINFPNPIEKTVYRNDYMGPSHCFEMSRYFWKDPTHTLADAKTFGLFVSRRTLPRCRMMYDCFHEFGNHFLLSHTLQSERESALDFWSWDRGNSPELNTDWVLPHEQSKFLAWWQTAPVKSLDDKKQEKMHSSDPLDFFKQVSSLLSHYSKFHIEMVAESYTRGECFFPTEKTTRPISSAKPLFVYAGRNYLSHLRDLGFMTWGKIWDETYDLYEGQQRWAMMKHEINRLCNLSHDDRKNTLIQAQKIADHNRRILSDMIGIR